MAIVNIPDQNRTLRDSAEIAAYLARLGITYERWDTSRGLAAEAPAEAILAAYAAEIEALKARGGYVTADVIDVNPQTPGLDAMLARFKSEHWHDEDEVRFILAGRGLFHLHPEGEPVVAIEVEAGDLISVPRQMHHWFNLCSDRRIRAIRLFQDPAGWTPHYTGSGKDAAYQPLCMGPADILASSSRDGELNGTRSPD